MPDDSGGELYSLTSVPRSSKSVQLPEPMIDERQIYVGGLPFKVTESEVGAGEQQHSVGWGNTGEDHMAYEQYDGRFCRIIWRMSSTTDFFVGSYGVYEQYDGRIG